MISDHANSFNIDSTIETEYSCDFQLILDEVNIAIESFYTYLEIHNFASESNEVFLAINESPTFWDIQRYSLQTTFFITLGRIFDEDGKAHSIHKLLDFAIRNPELFSKLALAKRKTTGEKVPDSLTEYLIDVFEPSANDLRELKRALKPFTKKYKLVYRDIRHQVFAHRGIKNKEDISCLFGETKIKEINEILYFLYDLLIELRELFDNGRRPELGIHQYNYKDRIKNSTRAALLKISN